MALISVTADNVANIDAATDTLPANTTITAGQGIFKNTTTNAVGLADADHGTAMNRIGYGIALNGGASGQPIQFAKGRGGTINIGGTVVVGATYFFDETAGGIGLYSDLASGSRVVRAGYGTAAAVFNVDILDYGVNVP
jgi:hypothetical protein